MKDAVFVVVHYLLDLLVRSLIGAAIVVEAE